MMKYIIALTALAFTGTSAAPALAANGPLSKFNGIKPVGEYVSTAKSEDIERCLIDMEGWRAPHIYRQPDRPNVVIIVWPDPSGLSVARMDLTRTAGGTRVKSWNSANQAMACTPR